MILCVGTMEGRLDDLMYGVSHEYYSRTTWFSLIRRLGEDAYQGV